MASTVAENPDLQAAYGKIEAITAYRETYYGLAGGDELLPTWLRRCHSQCPKLSMSALLTYLTTKANDSSFYGSEGKFRAGRWVSENSPSRAGSEESREGRAAIGITAHASLPAAFNQEFVAFVVALVKATKIIEIDKEIDRMESMPQAAEDGIDILSRSTPMTDFLTPTSSAPLSRINTSDTLDILASTPPDLSQRNRMLSDLTALGSSSKNRLNRLTKGLRDDKDTLRSFIQDMHQNMRNGVKKAVLGSLVNDRWIAKLMGKIGPNLETAHGDIGYSSEIPVSLERYRPGPGSDCLLSKLLP
ncbi:uncharacterized protein PV09_04705 [Verruconis gallopava]|uniref:Uncharacterized protein n=1 Tax=Verruconis gallopava TaxID=253628 RepID=A0A0D2AC59_9PEZI|nr:uncharacterized protein PV09_04705 [Verruconis gallopava]KIW04438.1 hypothetical protein PV09_04705 [Verruconis gallopava]